MADDAPRTLICLIQGTSQLFKLKSNGSSDIMDLREMIKKENGNYLQSVDASALTLWKVRLTLVEILSDIKGDIALA